MSSYTCPLMMQRRPPVVAEEGEGGVSWVCVLGVIGLLFGIWLLTRPVSGGSAPPPCSTRCRMDRETRDAAAVDDEEWFDARTMIPDPRKLVKIRPIKDTTPARA